MLTIPLVVIFILLILGIGIIIGFRYGRRVQRVMLPVDKQAVKATGQPQSHAHNVGKFYDRYNDAFEQVYGQTIQAFRTTDISTLLDYQARAMGLMPGMHILDAGCGIAGPAIYFAKKFGVLVDAVTISNIQATKALEKIVEAGLENQVRVYEADYHQLPAVLPPANFDVLYFLESFGHSDNKQQAIDAAWEMLRPGGLLYIKDLFRKEVSHPTHQKAIDENIRRINEAYHYRVSELPGLLTILQKKGFILSSVKTVDIPLEEFENLTISNTFQELTGINRIDNLSDYMFPVDFFELSCVKPWYDPGKGLGRYFLQNLYQLQVAKLPANEL